MATKLKTNPEGMKTDISSKFEIDISGEEYLDFVRGVEGFAGRHVGCGEGCRHLYGFYESVGLISMGNLKGEGGTGERGFPSLGRGVGEGEGRGEEKKVYGERDGYFEYKIKR